MTIEDSRHPRELSSRGSSVHGKRSNNVNSRSISLQSDSKDPSSWFTIDRKGDRRNLEYGEADRYAAPHYRLAGRGALIGMDREYRITSTNTSVREVQNIKADASQRPSKQSLTSDLPTEDVVPIKMRYDPANNLDQDFITFENISRRKRRRLMPSEAQHDLFFQQDDSDDSDSSLHDSVNDITAFDAFKNDPIHQRHMQLSKNTRDTPYDVRVWLELIEYQDTVFGTRQGIAGPVTASSSSLTNLKISLYEQALVHVAGKLDREKLIIGLMHEGSKIWDAQKQASQWDVYLSQDSTFDLWLLYLNFAQVSAVNYTTEECLKLYKRCISVYRSSSAGVDRDRQCIYLLLRLTMLLWETDYAELAIALWQALLEFSYFQPRDLQNAMDIKDFEDFWNSETARLGEEDAKGWRSGDRVEVDADFEGRHQISQDLTVRNWASVEMELFCKASLPARSLYDDGLDDPYRIVLFSDISPYLYRPITEEGFALLLDAFLIFCGLEPISKHPTSWQWAIDPFVYTGSISTSTTWAPGLADPSQQAWKPLSLARRPITIHPTLIQRTLHQLASLDTHNLHVEELMAYIIRLQSLTDLKGSRKTAKSFLKRRSDSLGLYDLYASIEYRLGNFELAEKVWSTTLSMQGSLQPSQDGIKYVVWRDWIRACMSQKRFRRAESLLAMLVENRLDLGQLDEEPNLDSVTTQIKFDRFIKGAIDSQLRMGCAAEVVPLFDLRVFYEYLKCGLDLSIALRSYQTSLTQLSHITSESRARALEMTHESRALLLHMHVTDLGIAFRPKDLREALAVSVGEFPENGLLLQLQHFHARNSGVMDRLREIELRSQAFHPPTKGKSNTVSSFFRLAIELDRPAYSGSTDHSIRAAFDKLTKEGESGAHSPTVWRTYVLWEASRAQTVYQQLGGKKESKKANGNLKILRDKFYASLRACPWSKELYMMAFEEEMVQDSLGEQALREVYRSMSERGLRLRIDINDNL